VTYNKRLDIDFPPVQLLQNQTVGRLQRVWKTVGLTTNVGGSSWAMETHDVILC